MKNPYLLLDTNVVSEILKPRPNENVLKNLRKYENSCGLSSTAWNELLFGMNIMAEGKKKTFIYEKLVNDIQSQFDIIQYDRHAALIQADIRSRLRAKGIGIEFQDSQIAAIAVSNCMVLVTRNIKHFEPIQEISPLMLENWFE